MNSVIIREPKIGEVLECVKVFLLSFERSDFSGIFDEEQAWIYLINQKIAKFLIAEKEDKIIGLGGVFLFQHVASIGYMGVLADYRKRGIGTLIFRNLMETATRLGYKTIMLYASKLGQPIYEKFGFQGQYNASRHYLIKAKPEKQDEPNNVKIIKTTPDWVLNLDRETIQAMAQLQAHGGTQFEFFLKWLEGSLKEEMELLIHSKEGIDVLQGKVQVLGEIVDTVNGARVALGKFTD